MHSAKTISPRFATTRALSAALMLGLSPAVLAQDTQNESGDTGKNEESAFVSGTKEFMSDGGRVGSAVGMVLAGASFAHPFAPLGGSIIGFLVGKSTDFSDDDEAEEGRFARRSFAPPEGSDGNASDGQLAMSGSSAGDTLAFSESSRGASAGSAQQAGNGSSSQKQEDRESHLVVTKRVGGFQEDLDKLAAQIRSEQNRPEFVPHPQCPEKHAPKYRKKVGIAGFVLERPQQGAFGGLYNAGDVVSEAIYQNMMTAGQVEAFHVPNRMMVASLGQMPTQFRLDNRLQKYSAASREMGVQFVVSGVIRSIAVTDEEAWNTSHYSQVKRALFSADTVREFVVDVVVHDGFTGRVVMEERYAASGRWDVDRTREVGFGTRLFDTTQYGEVVEQTLADITKDVTEGLACQPMLVPILRVAGKEMILDVGTKSGLLPGDHLKVLRGQRPISDPDGVPRLYETGQSVHIHSMNLENSVAWMPAEAPTINVQAGDFVVVH